MSFRDPHGDAPVPVLRQRLPGGEAHHDGGMKGRDRAAVLANPMLAADGRGAAGAGPRSGAPARSVITTARPPKGSPNLLLDADDVAGIQLPGTDKGVTARAGSEAAYCAVAKNIRTSASSFVRPQPLDQLGKAAALVPPVTRSR